MFAKILTEDSMEKDILPLPVQAIASVDASSTFSKSFEASTFIERAKGHFMAEIDPKKADFPFAWYCFMTGFTNAICYSAAFIWPAFHTGNVIQMAIAIGRLFQHATFMLSDKQSMASLLTFLIGAALGRIGDRIGNYTRAWLCLGTFLQALCTMAGALCAWKSGQPVPVTRTDPGWSNILSYASIGFVSASLGLQAIMAMRCKSPMGTTILATGFWCELAADSKLFKLKNPTRDTKLFAITSLFFGGFVARVIMQKIGAAGALGVGTAIRVLMTIGWLLAPAKPAER